MLFNKLFSFFLLTLFTTLSFSQNSFQKDIQYLTSQELGGRYPGTIEDSLAQQYISSRFSDLAIVPILPDTSYFQRFEFVSEYWFESTLKIISNNNTSEFEHNKDFQITRYGNTDTINSECIFIGYATDSSCLPFVKDKVVIMYASAMPPHNSTTTINRINISELRIAGAKAIINILPHGKLIKERVFKNTSQNANITALALTKQSLNRLIDADKISNYDSIAEKNIEKLPPYIESTSFLEISLKKHDTKIKTANLVGFKKGESNDYIIIGAHHDHLGRNKENNLIYPGANDNASGIAMLLNLAERFKDKSLNNNLLFIAFGAEEKGMLGSKYFVRNLPIDKRNVKAMINLDVIGQLKKDSLYYAKFNSNFNVLDKLEVIKENIVLEEKDDGMSDHIPFLRASIPTLYFTTGNDYKQLHSVEDKEELINYLGMGKISDLLFHVISELDNTSL